MRISDRAFQSEFIRNMLLSKSDLSKTQEKLVTGKNINRPSDSPLGTSRVMRLSSQLENISTYKTSIGRSHAVVDTSITAMEGINVELEKVLTDLASSNNPTLGESRKTYASNIDLALNQILELANSEFDGTYLFSGTNHSGKPFAFNGSKTSVSAQHSDISGAHKVKISKTLDQQINISGKKLFQSVLEQTGSFDSSQAVAANFATDSSKIYDADGNEYDFDLSFSKTAANSYTIDYDIDDGSGSVGSGSIDLTFNATTGELETVDGGSVKDINISVPGNKIDFMFDVSNLTEGSSFEANSTLSQKADIFNTLLSVKDKLNNGDLASDEQVKMIENFQQLLLDQMSSAGSISNRLTGTEEILANQELELRDLLSKENDVDVVKAMVDLETQQTNLDLSYKISAMILPKSIMDFI